MLVPFYNIRYQALLVGEKKVLSFSHIKNRYLVIKIRFVPIFSPSANTNW